MHALTWDLLEDSVAHELLKALCVETWPVNRHCVLRGGRDREGKVNIPPFKGITNRPKVLHGDQVNSHPIMNQSFPGVLQFLHKPESVQILNVSQNALGSIAFHTPK